MENILVAGATGNTGKRVIHLLKQSQYFNPVAMVRKEEQLKEFQEVHIDAVLGDLEEDVSHTVKNIDKIIFAAGSGGKKVDAVDRDGAKKIIDAAKTKGIKKFVMLSSMGANEPEKHPELQEYMKAKQEADNYLIKSNLVYAIVRPGTLNNERGSGKIQLKKSLNINGEISRDDVAQTLVRALHDDAAINETFEILEGDMLIGKALEVIA
ncbi:SDR family oxidoreductase [Flavobacteriaceae bacterium M23B6Z8]